MAILYLLTSPEPKFQATDAVFQEVELLRSRFGGDALNLFPLRTPSGLVPQLLCGLHRYRDLRRLSPGYRACHLFGPRLLFYPALRFVKAPVVYSVVASLQGRRRPCHLAQLKRLDRIVISNERDRAILEDWGLNNYSLIRPGVDLSRFSYQPVSDGPFTILMASAPWVTRQFATKGVDVLLETVRRMPSLRVVLLWRGLLADQLQHRIDQLGVSRQIEVINRPTDVATILPRVHATILLAARPNLVKAFPHSLIESVAAGRPVLVSETIPMADFVRKNRSGLTACSLDADHVRDRITQLIAEYDRFQPAALHEASREFSADRMLSQFETLYQGAC